MKSYSKLIIKILSASSLLMCLTLSMTAALSAALVQQTAASVPVKVMRDYRGVKLGMNRDEVQKLVGKPELSEAESDRFQLDNGTLFTVYYESDSVKALQIYFTEGDKAPSWTEVVGDAEIEEQSNGSKVARLELPEEKLRVSMYRSKTGETVSITISKLQL